MKYFNVSREDLSDILSMLWNELSEKDAHMVVEPDTRTIRVFKSGEAISCITVVNVTDEYDLRKAITEEV